MELWDLYDYNRKKIGKTHVRGVSLPGGCYHLVVHVWIQNEKGELLVSRRHPDKPYGNLWECTGGSVLAGEDSLAGALRETKEELGVSLNPIGGRLLHSEVRKTHHLDIWLFQSNVKIDELALQAEEVIDAKWVDRITYEKMLQQGKVVPTLHHFYNLVKGVN